MPLAGVWNDLEVATSNYDAEIHQNETGVIQCSVNDENGDDKDVDGATIAWRWGNKASKVFGAAVVGTIVTAGEGLIQVALTAVITAVIPVGPHDHQFIVTIGTDVQVVREGLILIKEMLPAA